MKTECSVVRDLLPLYVESMVSAETEQYITEHLKLCADCTAELDALKRNDEPSGIEPSSASVGEASKPFRKMMKRLNRQFYSVAYAALIFLIFLGFGWTAGNNLMYNSLIMPIVGVFGYYIFKWKAVYKVPVLLLLIDLSIFALQLIEIGFADTLLFTVLYAIFVLLGVAIAFLLHYSLGKEEKK